MSSGHKRYHSHGAGPANEPSRTAKRCREPDPDGLSGQHEITPDKYTVGWVCALPLEMAAAKGMLDKVHPNPREQDPSDHNTYLLGEVCGHNVVVACLPAGIYGTSPAATVAKDMLRTFKSIRFGLMVGIGGGIPSKKHDIRLGDVVVGQPSATNTGIVQYDRGNALQNQGFERTGSLNAPPQILLAALSRLQAEHLTDDCHIPEFLANLPQKMKKRFSHPGTSNDCLYLAKYPHVKDNPTCQECDHSQTVPRDERDQTDPSIHYGTIASGSQLIKDPKKRDQIEKSIGALCVETEAAGLQDFPSIVIRGICDYADSHKNDIWQFYAAAVAAAFAKELLSFMPPTRVLQVDPIPQLVSIFEESLDVSKQHLDVSSETLGEQKRTNKILEERPIDLHIVHEACYDSEDVGNSPRCEANTRVRLQETIQQWADDEGGESFLWLVGPAGTGKSTLIRSVADSFHRDKRLAAGYFFKRGERGRNDTNRLFSTLAIQLAEAIPHFKDSLRASLGDTDKDSIDKKDLRFQFEKLIKKPIQDLPPSDAGEATLIIVLDALDECEHPENLPRALTFISEICNKSKALNLRVLLASRPDPRITNAFEPLIQNGVTQRLQLHKVFSEDTKGDIRLYLQANFDRIKTKANIQEDPWPSVADLDNLVKLSTHPEPLFIYPATLLRFVYDERHLQNPKNQLKIWIKQCENNESQLHQMYNPILEQIFALGKDTDFDQQLQFLGVLVLTALPLSLASLTSLLNLDIDNVNWWLPSLHAVLDIPSDSHQPLRLLHKSFSDFLLSEDNPGNYRFRVDAREIHALLAHRCIEFMGKKLKRDICDLEELDVTPDDIDECLLDNCIPFELQYSCRYWVYHLGASGKVASGQITSSQILAFLFQHFLHWLEVLALLRQTSDAIKALQDLSGLVKNFFESSSELVDFLKDATRTIFSFASIIESAPLQTYASLILFSTITSRVRQQFWAQRLPPHSHIEGVKSNWDARLRTLDVSGFVSSLTFSPDGKLLAVACDEVQLFNASTGNHLMTFEGHGQTRDVVFSHNGHLLAASYPGPNATVKVWDITTWKEVQAIQTPSTISTVAFSVDDKVLILILYQYYIQSDEVSVEFWSIRSGILQNVVDFPTRWDLGNRTTISPKLEQFAMHAAEGTVVLWNLVTNTVQHTISVDGPRVSAMAFSPDGAFLAVECNRIVYVWDMATYSLKLTMKNANYSDRLCFCPHSQLLASVCFNQGVRVLDLATGSCRVLRATNTIAFAFSSDGQLLVTASSDNHLTVWDFAYLDHENHQSPLDVDTTYGHTLLLSPNGKLFVSHSQQDAIRIWDFQTGKLIRRFAEGAYVPIELSTDNKLLVSGHNPPNTCIWDVVDGTDQPLLELQMRILKFPVVYSTRGQLVLACWDDNTLELYDATNGSYLCPLRGHGSMIRNITLSPHGNLLALLSQDGTIQLWDTKTGTCQSVIQEFGSSYSGSLRFSPDDKILACHNESLIRWWDITTGFYQHTLGPVFERFTKLSFSPNSSLLGISVSGHNQEDDDEVLLYDVKTADYQCTLVGHAKRTLGIIFSPDSSKVAVESSSREVRLWDTTTYILLYIFDTCTDVPEITRFSNDGSIIAVASRDRAIRVWDVTTGDCLQMIYHDGGFIQELEVLANEVIVSVTDEEPDRLWDRWNTANFKVSKHSYPISAAGQTLFLERFSSEVSLDPSGHWVMRGEERIIYIPPEYRPMTPPANDNWIKRGHTVVYVCKGGKIMYLRLPLAQ